MEQLYLIEVFIDKVSIFVDPNDTSTANKNLICKVKFGPNVQMIIKEDKNAPKRDIIICDENNHNKFTRTLRAGKSYLFPSYPDTMLQILKNFPLEIEVWNDDDNEEYNIYVGVGVMHWDTEFFIFLKDTADVCTLHEPLAVKSMTPLMAECCCKQCGEITFIVRISALGDSITTEFLQLMTNPDQFIFATDKAPSKFECRRIEGDNPNFTMVGTLYETATLEDPEVIANANKKIEVCTELQSCGVGKPGDDKRCADPSEGAQVPKKYPVATIRMGDITGPCGNPNCKLAHKVKMYIRTLDSYRKEYSAQPGPPKSEQGKITRKVCGACSCKDDKWHRGTCPDKGTDKAGNKHVCKGCGGATKPGHTCEDLKKRLHNTGVTPTGPSPKASKTGPPTPSGPTPRGSKTAVNYVLSVTRDPELMESIFGKDFIVQNASVNYDFEASCCRVQYEKSCSSCFAKPRSISAVNVAITENTLDLGAATSACNFGQTKTFVYNASISGNSNKKGAGISQVQVYNCLTFPDDKDCKCEPKKPTPPCKTADCECITNLYAERNRKIHKPYCPAYKHKNGCPVLMLGENEEANEFEEPEEPEPLPYGLPPIQLGPCPVLGRPCSVPDGFARMYKIGAMPPQPPSYSDAGKVCCSKEYERIKKAIKEYLKNEKPADFRCINKFNVDTEKRCCDKENFLLSLMGKDCCGSHKMAIQEKYKYAPGLSSAAFPRPHPPSAPPAPPK